MKRFVHIISLSLILVGWTAAPALSANDNAANAFELFLGQAHLQSMSATTNYWYKANLVAGRSYAVYAWGPWADPSVSDLSLDLTLFEANGATAAATTYSSDIEPKVESNSAGGNNGEQRRIIPTKSEAYRIRVENNSSGAQSVYVMVVETTLFSPWYYVDSGAGYEAYVEMRNNTTSSLTAVVTAFDAEGTVVGTATETIPGNGARFRMVSSFGLTSAYGSLQIAHSGGPGGICANTTTLSGVTGLSFDAPFTPRMVWATFGY